MLLLRCSLEADSMSRSTSFCPSTMATRSSSCCVALNNIRFTCCSPARAGDGSALLSWFEGRRDLGVEVRWKNNLCALLVVSLLPVSEINQCFRPGCGRAGGGLQEPAPPVFLCLATRSDRLIILENECLKQATGHDAGNRRRGGGAAHRQLPAEAPARRAQEPRLSRAPQRRGARQ